MYQTPLHIYITFSSRIQQVFAQSTVVSTNLRAVATLQDPNISTSCRLGRKHQDTVEHLITDFLTVKNLT